MDTSTIKYPFGCCAGCGQEFNSELRNEYEITHCPWCGLEIDDFMTPANQKSSDDIYCEDCGQLIYRDGSWVYISEDVGAGVCSGPCGRELCGRCGDWDDEGCCPKCHEDGHST